LFTEKFENVKKFLLNFAEIKNDDLKSFEVLQNLGQFSFNYEKVFLNFSSFESFQTFFNFSKNVNVLTYYNEIKNHLEENFLNDSSAKIKLMERTFDHATLIHELIEQIKSSDFLTKLLKLISNFFNKDEILNLILEESGYDGATLFMTAAKKTESKVVKALWEISTFNNSEKREILLKEDWNLQTALQHSTQNKDPNSFLFMKEIYEKHLTEKEIRDVLRKFPENILPFIRDVIISASYETALEVSKYLENLFKNEKIELRTILSHRDEDGETAFFYLRNNREHTKKFEIFTSLFKKTFDENQEELFEKSFDILKYDLKVFKNNVGFRNISDLEWSEDDVLYFIENFEKFEEKLSAESLRKILQMKHRGLETFLSILASNSIDEHVLEKIPKYLNRTEIFDLILAENHLGDNSFIKAAEEGNFKFLKAFWNFIDKNLEENEKNEILTKEDNHLNTALHYSTRNQDPKSFLCMKKIYEIFFTKAEIRKALSRIHNYRLSFIDDVILFASLETALEVSKYLENLFENEKIELRKILSHREWNGSTIFLAYKNQNEYKEKLSIFTKLLRKTFGKNQEKEFEKYLKALHLKLSVFRDYTESFQNFTAFKSALSWSQDDFKFLIYNFDELKIELGEEKLKKVLPMKGLENETILHDLNKVESFEDFSSVLEIISSLLNKTQISSLIFSINNSKQTPLALVTLNKNLKTLKTFWKFCDENSNQIQIKEALIAQDKFLKNILQLSTRNSDSDSFLFIRKIYEIFLSKSELKEILADSLEDMIKNLNLEILLEVSKYLENLFKNEKLELRKMLSHINEEGETIFSKINLKYENFTENKEIFVELLRKTFDENQQEEFEETLKDLED
jgi:hypothetical protein